MANEVWVVRAGQRARYLETFRESDAISIGFEDVADEDVMALGEPALLARGTTKSLASGVSQLRRFAFLMDIDDFVITPGAPGSDQRYFVGRIAGPYRFTAAGGEQGPHQRAVSWLGDFGQGDISAETRNSLDAASTLFKPTRAEAELRSMLAGLGVGPTATPTAASTSSAAPSSWPVTRSRSFAPAQLEVETDATGRATIRAHYPALEMEQTPRHLDPSDVWRHVPGIYVLTGTELDTSTSRTGFERALTTTLVMRPWAYVGLSENFFGRLSSHRQSKPEWRRALLVRSGGRPFGSDDIRYLERRVFDLLEATEEVQLAQTTPHGTISASPRDTIHLDACADTLLTVLRLTGTLI